MVMIMSETETTLGKILETNERILKKSYEVFITKNLYRENSNL